VKHWYSDCNCNHKITDFDSIEFKINDSQQTILSVDFSLSINMDEKPLSEVADFLEMFVSEIEVPEAIRNETVSLNADKKSMKEIISDLGLEMSQKK
jgi:predicted transcriptional regulator YheO